MGCLKEYICTCWKSSNVTSLMLDDKIQKSEACGFAQSCWSSLELHGGVFDNYFHGFLVVSMVVHGFWLVSMVIQGSFMVFHGFWLVSMFLKVVPCK